MPTSAVNTVAINVLDASDGARERWGEVCRGMVEVDVRLHSEAMDVMESLGRGVWVLVPDSLPARASEIVLALARGLPASALVMVASASETSHPEDGAVGFWMPRGTADMVLRNTLASMVRAFRAEEGLAAALKFPSENPHPVLRFSRAGELIYANPSAEVVMREHDEFGSSVATRLEEEVRRATDGTSVEISMQDATYWFRFESYEPTGFFNVYGIDITDSVKAVESRLQSEKHSRNKDIFLATMSHELRTPLNAVLSCTEAMTEGVYGPMTLKQHEAVGTIRRSGQHLLSLISDILDISKIEAGALEINPSELSVRALCDSVVEISRASADQKKIKIVLSYDDDVPSLRADPLRMKQVLLNLLGNAIKFTPEYGDVGLTVRRGAEPETIDFKVWDTGPGVSSIHADTIFQSFVQAEGDEGNPHPGTGLGLTIAQHLSRMHGGKLVLEKLDGPGAVFVMTVPIGEVGVEDDQSLTASEPWRLDTMYSSTTETEEDSKEIETILIAEDTDSNYEHLHDMLVSLGYTVERARDGQEAIDMCRTMNPDLILMDIDMPRVNGIEAIREIRNDGQTRHPPIIAVTANSDFADERACLQAGADGFLAKPYPLRDLMMLMQRVSG